MLPKPVYETLPLLYVTGRITAISSINAITAIISGALLASGGIVILFLRRRNRNSYCRLVKPEQDLIV